MSMSMDRLFNSIIFPGLKETIVMHLVSCAACFVIGLVFAADQVDALAEELLRLEE